MHYLCSSFTIHHSSFVIYHSPFTIHHSPFIHHSSTFIHHSSFRITHRPFITHHSSFTTHHSFQHIARDSWHHDVNLETELVDEVEGRHELELLEQDLANHRWSPIVVVDRRHESKGMSEHYKEHDLLRSRFNDTDRRPSPVPRRSLDLPVIFPIFLTLPILQS